MLPSVRGDVNAFATGGVEVIAIGFEYVERQLCVVDELPVGADGGVGAVGEPDSQQEWG